jgi:hypothetical protein
MNLSKRNMARLHIVAYILISLLMLALLWQYNRHLQLQTFDTSWQEDKRTTRNYNIKHLYLGQYTAPMYEHTLINGKKSNCNLCITAIYS